MRALWIVLALMLTSVLAGAALERPGAEVLAGSGDRRAQDDDPVMDTGCGTCHTGIEDMHPGFPLSCVDCHGGDPDATTKSAAHIAPTLQRDANERVAPRDFDLAHVRFVNPMDLRVAEKVCGECHGELVEHLMVSLHGTTAAHLSDGFFEVGLQEDRDSRYAVFDTDAPKAKGVEHTITELNQPPKLDPRDDPHDLRSHFPDLIRKECMQCHLWSEGRAVRGRVGFDGEYRGGGCAACHVPYRVDGLSESTDPTVDRVEPGHPRVHRLVEAPPTETCTTCHYGDASIGLHFRGLSQLPPNAPGGPEVEGTTDALLHRSFFVNDPAVTPPDVHHASGLHCVDCHTLEGVMGDGRMVSKMEEATEITCQACHGTFEAPTDMTTERGNRLKHLFERDGQIWMRSKVTGAEHRIKQVVDVIDVASDDYNEQGALAMTGAHGDIACYTCHAGWNVNFLGFHFYRNEALTQLDLLSGQRTKGRVTTQEKVFSTWKSFYAGLDEKGRVAPYLTGFSTMGTVDGEDGTRLLDQEFPVTQNGLSGLTMIHHQLHSTRPTARSCVECHRASETWGMGSANFRLGRQVGYVADRRGIEVLALDRENPQLSVPLAKLPLPDVVDLCLQTDPLQGFSEVLFALEEGRGVHSLDASDPTGLARLDFHMAIDPRELALAGTTLYLADGVAGLKVFDASDPAELTQIGSVPTLEANAVEVRWPYAYVADGPGGLLVIDVRVPSRPKVVGGLDTDGAGAVDLDVLFQYSRPLVDGAGRPSDERTPARRLVALLDKATGLIMVDATEPRHLAYVDPPDEGGRTEAPTMQTRVRYRAVEVVSHVDVASPQGGTKTVERDVAYVLAERNGNNVNSRIFTYDVSDPRRPERMGVGQLNGRSSKLTVGAWYTPPVLRPLALASGNRSLPVFDIGNSAEPSPLGSVPPIRSSRAFVAEFFPLDRMLDEDGQRLKDVSHPHSRWLLKGEIEEVLAVTAEQLGLADMYDQATIAPASGARVMFARADADGNGVLAGKELKKAGPTAVDADGDGLVTLADFGGIGRSFAIDQAFAEGEDADDEEARRMLERRNGALAKVLDAVDPFDFERKKDGRLDRTEFEAAYFAALDVNGDGALDVHERSRRPGDEGRVLRLSPGREVKVRKRQGTFRVTDEEWRFVDVDGDGAVQLDPSRGPRRQRRGFEAPPLEWPDRRGRPPLGVSPVIRIADVLEEFDSGGKDGRLSKSELRRRPDLFRQLDLDRSSVVEPDELERIERVPAGRGVDGVPDLFVDRWDLDGSGEVEPDELPPLVRTLLERRRRR